MRRLPRQDKQFNSKIENMYCRQVVTENDLESDDVLPRVSKWDVCRS